MNWRENPEENRKKFGDEDEKTILVGKNKNGREYRYSTRYDVSTRQWLDIEPCIPVARSNKKRAMVEESLRESGNKSPVYSPYSHNRGQNSRRRPRGGWFSHRTLGGEGAGVEPHDVEAYMVKAFRLSIARFYKHFSDRIVA